MSGRIKAVVRYDGAQFAGWQVQPGERTVQGVLEQALSRIRGEAVRIHGAGRTDSGVHALGQVFSCTWPQDADTGKIRRSLSKMLGPEIRVLSVELVPEEFHAQKDAVSKRYAYAIDFSAEPEPFSAAYSWSVPWDVDLAGLRALARRLVGEHDFAGFCSSGSSVETTTRTIYSLQLKQGGVAGPMDNPNLFRLEFHGNGFLYKMVRNITGTLVDIARGAKEEKRLDELLRGKAPRGLEDTVVINIAAALHALGRRKEMRESIDEARDLLLGGAVRSKLDDTKEFYASR